MGYISLAVWDIHVISQKGITKFRFHNYKSLTGIFENKILQKHTQVPQLLTDKLSYEPVFCEIDPPLLRDVFKTVLAFDQLWPGTTSCQCIVTSFFF